MGPLRMVASNQEQNLLAKNSRDGSHLRVMGFRGQPQVFVFEMFKMKFLNLVISNLRKSMN